MIKGWTLFLTCTVLSFGLILVGCPKKETADEMAPEPMMEAPAEVEEEAEEGMMEMEEEMMETEGEMMEMEEEPMEPN